MSQIIILYNLYVLYLFYLFMRQVKNFFWKAWMRKVVDPLGIHNTYRYIFNSNSFINILHSVGKELIISSSAMSMRYPCSSLSMSSYSDGWQSDVSFWISCFSLSNIFARILYFMPRVNIIRHSRFNWNLYTHLYRYNNVIGSVTRRFL